MAITPPPHLEAAPLAERVRYDAAMAKRMDDAALARARRDLIERGWGEADPAPPAEAVARAHREAVQ
jgi:hypothetical protein